MRVTRRGFVRAASMAAGGAVTSTLYAWRIEPHWLEIVRRPLPVRGVPSSLAGCTLVQISDVHVGMRVDDEYVIDVFQRVADLRPDIVVLTGDLISHHDKVFEQMANVYRHFPTGRLATLGVLGNHDYGPAWSHPEIAERVVESVAPFGITILRNEVQEVEGLQVVGLDDLWGRRFDASMLSRLDDRRAAIALSHNPDAVDLPGWERFQGWILSGHTHGGQCRPPFLPPPLLPVRNRRYTAGEFELAGGRRLYINRGVGHLRRVRFNCRPEVTVFRLERA